MNLNSNISNISRLSAYLSYVFFVSLLQSNESLAFTSTNKQLHEKSCAKELENANSSLTNWAQNLEQMVSDAKLPQQTSKQMYDEANAVLDQIEDFGVAVESKKNGLTNGTGSEKRVVDLARDLVALRRRANTLALGVYLSTMDMRWPAASMALGNIVERVQQACLDTGAIQALEAPPNLTETLTKLSKTVTKS